MEANYFERVTKPRRVVGIDFKNGSLAVPSLIGGRPFVKNVQHNQIIVNVPTVLENPFYVQAVSSTSFIIRAPFEIIGQLSGSRIVDDSRVTFAYCIWKKIVNQ